MTAGSCQINPPRGRALRLQGGLSLHDPLVDIFRLGQLFFHERQIQVFPAELLDFRQELLHLTGVFVPHVGLGDFIGPELVAHLHQLLPQHADVRGPALAPFGPQRKLRLRLDRRHHLPFRRFEGLLVDRGVLGRLDVERIRLAALQFRLDRCSFIRWPTTATAFA